METTNVMKSILTILISFGLALSVFGQTRNVVVGTNGAIVQPTNFWSADVTNARSGLGLGSAATNSSSAFQPSSVALSNLASSNGSILTNIQASNIVGVISSSNISPVVFTNISGVLTVDQGGTSATNAYDARQNFGITAIGDALFTASNAATARTAIGGTDVGSSVFTLANPSAITFLRVNADNTVSAIGASDFRTAIGLGSSATNASSAFQPASSMLTNLASSNAFYLSNIQASNITGLLGLTNGGTGADNAINARANLGLGSASTNPASAFQPSSAVLSNLASSNGVNLTNITISNLTGVLTTNGNGAGLTNLTAANITGTVALASNVSGVVAISNGGTGATNAAIARTNLGLGWSVLTNTNFASALLGTKTSESSYGPPTFYTTVEVVGYTNSLVFTNANVRFGGMQPTNIAGPPSKTGVDFYGNVELNPYDNGFGGEDSPIITVGSASSEYVYISGSGISFSNGSEAATRTNLGLGASWLTNTNNPVFVSTNGEVVSPTNFWQVAPIQTLVQSIILVTNSTNAATNARNLYVYSLATNIINVTNTVTLPTNTSSFDGDEVTVIHRGGSNSVTAVRQLGSTNNLISLNSYDESVKFIKDGNWDFYHNISFMEAIRFSGTNAAANAGASRTNLGLGESNNVIFNSVKIYDTTISNNVAIFSSNGFYVGFEEGIIGVGDSTNPTNTLISFVQTNEVNFSYPINFATNAIPNAAATTRTNLGIPLAALTNTNNATFQQAIFTTNTAPTNAGTFGDHVAWMGVSIVTNGVTNVFKIPLYK